MKPLRKFWILTLLFFGVSCGVLASEDFDFTTLGRVPILHEGRVKPLETFARTHLLMIYGRSSLPSQSAMSWLMELLLDPDQAYQRPVFRIRNVQVLALLKLEPQQTQLYPFSQLSEAFRPLVDMVQTLHARPKEERTPTQNQLIDVYLKMLRYYEISRSMSLIFPLETPLSNKVTSVLHMDSSTPLTYVRLIPKLRLLRDRLVALSQKKSKKFSAVEKQWLSLAHQVEQLQSDTHSNIFRVIPPQWGLEKSDVWVSFWEMVSQSKGGAPMTMRYLDQWQTLYHAYHQKNPQTWKQAAQAIQVSATQMTQGSLNPRLLQLEQGYDRVDPFYWSLIAYVLAFLLLIASSLWMPLILRRLSHGVLWAGFVLHVLGIVARIIIMGRPPVSTLYESIVFVGAIGVLGLLILEGVRKDSVGNLVATMIGSILHFIARGYADDGDTLGMLVAVLNTNFWLATHVVAITIGYGCSLVGGVLAHVYVVKRLIAPHASHKLQELYRSIFGVALFALLFSLSGTILGGIWADQSWGRFWGWDPKENGALLLVLWLIMVIHGKISGLLGRDGFAIGMLLTNVIVALAWFGVNLLSVGLHSYGFADNVAFNLFLFCGVEIFVAAVGYLWFRRLPRTR